MRLPSFFRRKNKPQKAPVGYYSLESVKKIIEEVSEVAYNEGKREGIAISRQLATNSLKEIIWQQNQNHSPTTKPTQRS